MANKRLPSLFYNPLSMFGGTAALVSFCVILFLVLLDVFSHGTSPYMGILAFIIMPAVLVLGLILIPIGKSVALRGSKNNSLKIIGHYCEGCFDYITKFLFEVKIHA